MIFVINSSGLTNRFIPILKNYYSEKSETKKYNFDKNIYLVGDSHAGRLFNSLQNNIANNQYNLRIFSTPFFENHKLINIRTNKEKVPESNNQLIVNEELSKIITKDKNNNLIDEVSVYCETKDEKSSCLKEIRISDKTKLKEEIHFYPVY